MVEIVGWDLDSSVASTMHRRYLIPEIRAGRKTWHDYSLLCAEDEPIEGAVALMRFIRWLDPRVRHVAISGRSVRAEHLTWKWAERHNVPLSRLMLRPDDAPNGDWKVVCIRQLEAEGHTVRLFVEDWAPSARHIREQTGVPVLGVNPFDEGSTLVTREQLAEALRESDGFEYGELKVSIDSLAERVFAELGGSF